MSAYLRDIGNNAVGGLCIEPRALTTTAVGTIVDLINGDGRCTLIQCIGVINSLTNISVSVAESSDNSTFTAISGAVLNTLNTSSPANTIAYLTFDRSARYICTTATLSGGTTLANMSIAVIEQKKQV